jgi:metal-dependent amidase/aminoacylase/carboxypeptidase family protein
MMEDVYERVVTCAKAGALGTGATLEFAPPRTALKAPIKVPEFITVVADSMKMVGVSEEEIGERDSFGSADLGNVGNAFPTVNVVFKIAPKGIAWHSDAFREAAGSDEGWDATVMAGKVIALTAYELLTIPEKVDSIKAEFEELKTAEGK